MTPAQASGHPSFVTDVPVQGPTDPTMREAACRHAKTLPAHEVCVDCGGGPIPMWTRHSLCIGNRSTGSGIGEQISFGGKGALGFAFGAAGDPSIWDSISGGQQEWVLQTLISLNDMIVKTTGTTCPTYQSRIEPATGCFQSWFNAQNLGFTKPDGSALVLRTDSVLDQDTLDALRTVAALHPQDFPTPYPGTVLPGLTDKLSTGAKVGIGVAVAAVVGGGAYYLTRRRRRS